MVTSSPDGVLYRGYHSVIRLCGGSIRIQENVKWEKRWAGIYKYY